MDASGIDDATIGGKVQINLADMDLASWEFDLGAVLFFNFQP
jgi:hypothetical protein